MKTILTYGTFDLFHVGHVRLLKRLSSLGDRLIVGVSTDDFNKSKDKESFSSYEERAEIVASCRYVDEVIPEFSWSQKQSDIKLYNVDVFAMGDDWVSKFDHLKEFCSVVYLPRTQSISTTEIKNQLAKINRNDLDDIEQSLHDVINIVRSISN